MILHEIQGHIQSLYLVEYPDRLLLLDAGCRCDVEVVEAYARSIQRSLSELKLVVVTHMHPDHAGGAQEYRRRYGAQIVSGADEDWYKGLSGSVQHLIDILLAYWVASRMGRPLRWLWYPKLLDADLHLQEGDQLPGFVDWSIKATPGHTGEDISLWHASTGTLYVADVILKVRGRFIAPFPVEFPELYERTLQQLLRLDIREMLMAHGGRSGVQAEDFWKVLSTLSSLPRKKDVFASILGKLVKIP